MYVSVYSRYFFTLLRSSRLVDKLLHGSLLVLLKLLLLQMKKKKKKCAVARESGKSRENTYIPNVTNRPSLLS